MQMIARKEIKNKLKQIMKMIKGSNTQIAEIMVTLRNMTEQKFLDETSSNEIKLIVQKFSFVQKFFEKFEKIVQMLDFMKKDNSIR